MLTLMVGKQEDVVLEDFALPLPLVPPVGRSLTVLRGLETLEVGIRSGHMILLVGLGVVVVPQEVVVEHPVIIRHPQGVGHALVLLLVRLGKRCSKMLSRRPLLVMLAPS